MFQSNEPIFENHGLLRASALTEAVSYERKNEELRYRGYANGILDGVRMNVEEDCLIVNPGRIWYEGHVYIMTEKVRIELGSCKNQMSMIKVRFHEPQIKNGIYVRSSEIVISHDLEIRGNELELCRFHLQNGAKLRNDYQDLVDFCTIYDTIQIVDAPFAALGEPSVSPEITTYFGRELYQRDLEHPYDVMMAMECVKGQTIQREMLILYIGKRLNRRIDQIGNTELVRGMAKILEQTKAGQRRMLRQRETRMILE